MTSNFDLNSPEQIAANKAKREQARVKKAKQRVRYAEQKAIDTILATLATNGENYPAAQQAIWQRAKSKLSEAELRALQTRQDEFLGLAMQVQDVIDGLPKGRKIDPPDGLPFIDTLYDTCLSGGFVLASDGTSLVFHLMGEEFADLHRDISTIVYKHFSENIDSEWFKFGYYTRFLTDTWNRFVDVVAEYIPTHTDDENLEKDITDKIIAEWQKRQLRHRPVGVDFNSSESYQCSASEVIRASQVAKEIDAQKSLLDPFNQSNYQF